MLTTIATVFVAAIVASYPTYGLNYKSLALSGAAAVLVWIANSINPAYKAYGLNAE